jgi:prepilin signal peptidase PulO-like enzyme (type II secretory pathway)
MGPLLVHCLAALGVSLLVGLLVLGWRDREAVDLGDQLATVLSMLVGFLFGVLWELVEFVLDWARVTDLQASNSQTMLDLVWNDVGAVVGALLAARLYCHVVSACRRQELGHLAAWLVAGPSHVLDRQGVLVTIVVAAGAALTVASLWFAGRPMPGFPNG